MAEAHDQEHSDTESFHSARSHSPPPLRSRSPPSTSSPRAASPEATPSSPTTRFSPEEEATLLTTSATHRETGNAHFSTGAYSTAISSYDHALAACPNYLDYELAVLRANVAACHVKLGEWAEAVASASKALDGLQRLDPMPTARKKGQRRRPPPGRGLPSDGNDKVDEGEEGDEEEGMREGAGGGGGVVEEISDATAARIEALAATGHTHAEVQRLRIKALLRRAKARTELGGWSNLQGASEDYTLLAGMRELAPLDRKAVDLAVRTLPSRLDAAKQAEMGEMMGKLKELGNGILRPFGLSTNNFQFTKDEQTGGYSMQFNQGKGGDK